MEKVIITADTVLKIIQSVFNDNDIDQIQSGDLPEDWQGKSIQEILNIKYYTFKHRPESTEMIVSEMKRDGVPVDELAALNRSFGCLILNSVERIFAKNTDVATCDATLDFWVQTSKIKLLEYLIDKANIALSGQVLPLEFQMQGSAVEQRTVAMVFGRVVSPEYDPTSAIGESVQCSVDVQLTIQPSTILMSDIKVEFATEAPVDPTAENAWDSVMTEVVAESFSPASICQTKALPLSTDNSRTGVINTSRARTFSITIPAMKNSLSDWLNEYMFGSIDINTPLYMRVSIGDVKNILTTVITELHPEARNDGTEVVYSLTLGERGL